MAIRPADSCLQQPDSNGLPLPELRLLQDANDGDILPVWFHYIVVRGDLAHGLQAAQITHAAGESARLSEKLPPDTHAVVLRARDEAALSKLGQALDTFGIRNAKIIENTAPYEGQLMAIGIAPCLRTPKLRSLTKKFQLLK